MQDTWLQDVLIAPAISVDLLGVGKTAGSKVGARRRRDPLIGVRSSKLVFFSTGLCKARVWDNMTRVRKRTQVPTVAAFLVASRLPVTTWGTFPNRFRCRVWGARAGGGGSFASNLPS